PVWHTGLGLGLGIIPILCLVPNFDWTNNHLTKNNPMYCRINNP
ncbi:LOW QUALITY PROTEIN: hypothetical protein TorRG33x02_176810, partial [Trema orientale]